MAENVITLFHLATIMPQVREKKISYKTPVAILPRNEIVPAKLLGTIVFLRKYLKSGHA